MRPSLYSFLLLIFSFLLISVSDITAQTQELDPQENSPYSRYGIGNLASNSFAANGAMGGITAAFNSPFYLNVANPASYAFLGYTSFDVGFFYKYTNLQSPSESLVTHNGNLTNLALGFPIYNPINRLTKANDKPFYWGMSLGLVPFSTVGYNIEQTITLDSIGAVTQKFQGKGQLYKAYWGNGFRWKGFAAGFNIGYMFGNISRIREVRLDDATFALEDDLIDDTSHSGFTWDLGVQYQHTFGKLTDDEEERKRRNKKRLTIGIAGNGPIKVSTNSRQVYSRQLSTSVIDTVLLAENVKGTATFPTNVTAGFTITQDAKWTIGADFNFANWSNFEHPDLVAPLDDTWKVSIGGELIPDYRSIRSYFKQVRYRAGFFYGTDPRVIGDTQLTQYGATFGLGLPVRRTVTGAPSFVNLTFEGGRMGNVDLIMENYFRVTFGFTLNDNRWFYKRKFQ